MKPKIIIQDVFLEEIIDDPPPPPPGLKPTFKTLEDWLTNICDSDRPKKSISSYAIGLFESKDDYTLFFDGVK